MKVALIGSVAMGCILGAALARSGAEIVCSDRNPAVVAALQGDGIRVRGVLGDHTVPVRAVADPALLGLALPSNTAVVLAIRSLEAASQVAPAAE
jgi:2-dehydropantoate 2-reductase